jgi:hypothetical protein
MPVDRPRFDVVDREQLAAQVVSIMDAHFQRPSVAEKRQILQLATQQIDAAISRSVDSAIL